MLLFGPLSWWELQVNASPYLWNPGAPGSKYNLLTELSSTEETLHTGRARANQKLTEDQSFMNNLLTKGREFMVVEEGWEGTIQCSSSCSGNSDGLLDTWEATYQTAGGNQASGILLLKKLFIPLWKNKFNQSSEKVTVLLWPWQLHGFCGLPAQCMITNGIFTWDGELKNLSFSGRLVAPQFWHLCCHFKKLNIFLACEYSLCCFRQERKKRVKFSSLWPTWTYHPCVLSCASLKFSSCQKDLKALKAPERCKFLAKDLWLCG